MFRFGIIITLVFIGFSVAYFHSPYLGNPHAMYLRGNCYYYGQGGFHRDFEKARHWLTKAANAGHAKAQNNLATLYLNGWGVPENLAEAKTWFAMAATQGYEPSMYNLGSLIKETGEQGDAQEAVSWFQKAAEANYSPGQMKLGEAYRDGYGVASDSTKAFEWFAKSADQGLPEGCLAVGELLMLGEGVEQNKSQGLAWLMLSGNRGAVEKGRAECTEQECKDAVKLCRELQQRIQSQPSEGSANAETVKTMLRTK
ncbi:MAG: sel1 repeat family protein [Candidatus Riflebacteria bacterium]|nr:sel1 repeat family protein [Candidatus Riflebacteria bacterium]